MSTRINPDKGNEKVCYVTVSDGTTVYQAYQEKYAFGMINSPAIRSGSMVNGGVTDNQQYLILNIQKGNKVKRERFRVTDTQAAQ